MERDTHLTFRQIHGSKRAMVAQMNEIEESLVVKRRRQTRFHLRFILPTRKRAPDDHGNIVNLRLSTLKEFDTNFDYVAASYTWNQPSKLESDMHSQIPEYRIWTSSKRWRPPRCPVSVLHRTFEFACRHLRSPMLWVDQECILQDDPKDVEWHLQKMHKIYSLSRYTLALLSTSVDTLATMRQMEAFKRMRFTERQLKEHSKSVENNFTLAKKISEDVWFTRTWTFQERYSASILFFLLPLAPDVAPHAPQSCDSAYRTDFDGSVWRFDQRFDGGNKRPHPSDLVIAGQTFDILSYGIDDYIESVRGRLGREGKFAINLQTLLNMHFRACMADRTPHKRQPKFFIPFIQDAFATMQACENTVVADRLAILSNVCHFRLRLTSYTTNKRRISFSTCLLVLLYHNAVLKTCWPSRMEVAEKVMDVNVVELIANLPAIITGKDAFQDRDL